jgi:predicted XRE-type DNA-binding protein
MERKRSPNITPEMAAHIRFLVEQRGLYQHQAAALVGINQGRISEIMRGKRYPDVAPSQGQFPF